MQQVWVGILVVAGALAPVSSQGRAFGRGCRGPLTRIPTTAISAPPILGTTFDLELDAKAANAPFFLVMGITNQTWAGLPLPLDMSLFGFPGCFLNVEYRVPFPLVSSAQGTVKLPVSTAGIPPGARFYSQLVVPSGSTLGTSAGFEITFRSSTTPYSVLAIPDSQSYTVSPTLALHFDAQTKWIVNNLTTENIAFVSHVGDMVDHGAVGTNQNQLEWDRAVSTMARLDGNLTTNPDGLVRYGVAIGNHDYDTPDAKVAAAKWNSYFGASRFATRSWFKGTTTKGLSSVQVFNAGGGTYLHIALEWLADDDIIAWAQDWITANPLLPTIITTHQYLGWGIGPGYDLSGGTPDAGGDNSGDDIREKLVEPFPQVFMVICGHHSGGSRRESKTRLGQAVVECLFDYQTDVNGGNGWMNKLKFLPDRAEIDVVCLSPTYVPGVTPGFDRGKMANNTFLLKFDSLAHRRKLEATTTVHFTEGRRHGASLYSSTEDTYVRSNAASSSFGVGGQLLVDSDSNGRRDQALIKFGKIFGALAGQIPPGKNVARAVLTLTTEGPGANAGSVSELYQLTVPFTEASTWNSLGAGIQVGTETLATPTTNTGTRLQTKSTRSFNVTKALRNWQVGAPNHGWVLINTTGDTWAPRSSEWGTAVERPMLTVIYEN